MNSNHFSNLVFLTLILIMGGCSSVKYTKTVKNLDILKFMGDWYVVAGRTTWLEKGATNSLEQYTWNEKENRIDINFTFNKDSFDGPLKTIGQKAWIYNEESNAHWKVQPFWPLKLDYLVLAVDEPDYQWTVVGVPNQAYLWFMTRDPNFSHEKIKSILKTIKESGYSIKDVEFIPHNK